MSQSNRTSSVTSPGAKEQLPLKRKVAYASTDMAGNLLYCTITSFAMYYYTDVFGIPVAMAGLILLIARIVDALDAPVWGFVIDHTRTRWGQSRPYWLWLSVPFAIVFILAFWSPDLSDNGKFYWALITYLLVGIVYTGIATPITSILPNLSTNSDDRLKLNSFRMVGGMLGFLITASCTLLLVPLLGHDEQSGWRNTAILWGVIGAAMLLYAFYNTREINVSSAESLPIKKSIRAAKNNWPWVILVIAATFYWIGNTSRITAMIYFTEYKLGDRAVTSILNALLIFQIIGMLLIPLLVKYTSKTTVFIAGLVIAAVGQSLLITAGDSLFLLCFYWSVAAIGTGVAVSMPFAMLADTVDYGQFKNGVRAAGFLTAIGSAFSIKLGAGLGGWFPALIMSYYGYVPNTVQSAASLDAITFCFTWLPAIVFLFAALLMIFYYRYEKQEAEVKAYILAGENK